MKQWSKVLLFVLIGHIAARAADDKTDNDFETDILKKRLKELLSNQEKSAEEYADAKGKPAVQVN